MPLPTPSVRTDDLDDDESDKDTAYFQYYALLSHQAQMLQDGIRTTAYQKAILAHAEPCFRNRTVIDVGAGNGILSIFAAQAGARRVFAVEASNMIERLQHLIDASKPSMTTTTTTTTTSSADAVNPWLADTVVPVGAKMEDVTAEMLQDTQQVDTVISECLGVLLVHERMCESFLDARDRFLKAGGAMLPSSGTICLAPIEDKVVWEEAASKARFWTNRNFYGVDITPFSEAAWEESFSSPVVGCFGPLIVLTPSNDYTIDFQTIAKEDLKRFTIPLAFEMTQTAVVHGLGGWFDLHFLPSTTGDASSGAQEVDMDFGCPFPSAPTGSVPNPELVVTDLNVMSELAGLGSTGASFLDPQADPSVSSTYMSTSPFATSTHWQQVRFLLREPLAVNKGQRLVGKMFCEVNQYRSYTLTATLQVEGGSDPYTQRTSQWRLDRQVYSWTSAAPAPQ